MKRLFQNIHNYIAEAFRRTTLKTQLLMMYFFAFFAPILIVSAIAVTVNVNRLHSYQQDMTNSNNKMVRSMLFEITNQIYNASEDIVYQRELQEALSTRYENQEEFDAASELTDQILQSCVKSSSGVKLAKIYYDGIAFEGSGNVLAAGEEVRNSAWFSRARNQYSILWTAYSYTDEYNNAYWSLALVRQIPLYQSDAKAVLVVALDDNYLRSRIEEDSYYTILTMPDDMIAYSSNRQDCGKTSAWDIPQGDNYYASERELFYGVSSYMSCVTTLKMLKSDSCIHVVTLSKNAKSALQQMVWIIILIVLLALVLPGLIMTIFTRSIVKQVFDLRDEMYMASQEKYDLGGFDGCYELTQAYNDLQTLIERIQDRDARMYRKEIAEQQLVNEQQKMEFKMLASQINPHFLYNTLEMIRMKALASGDRETATAIRLLGQSMRYVLDNTGTEFTTLAKEMKHIDTYLQIQKLRFGDRVNYFLEVDDHVDLEEVPVLPLLLQPIVENAVLHGLEEVESGGRIEVKIQKESYNSLCISISDNGCGMDAETLENMRSNLEKGHINNRYGIGLYNINRRLRMNYGPGYGVTIDSKEGEGTTVTCRLKSNPELK